MKGYKFERTSRPQFNVDNQTKHSFRINTRHIKLVIGDHDRRKQETFQEIRTIDKVFIRPDFVKRTFNNDIALLKLNRKVIKLE